MDPETHRASAAQAWKLIDQQHGVISRRQLVTCGYSDDSIRHRVRSGRLFRVHRGIYVAGRRELRREGRWMAAILRCGPDAALSHASAAALWGIEDREGEIEIAVRVPRRAPKGVRVHLKTRLAREDLSEHRGIPLTCPVLTLIDLAARLSAPRIEAAVNAADRLGFVDPETLRSALNERGRAPGAPALRRLLDRRTFRLTDSELERRFLRLVRSARLPVPVTSAVLHGFKTDFHWPALGLVVETDGLRYHRTPSQQARDRKRDQAHVAAGLTTLRFTHAQVRYEPERVRETLAVVISRLMR